MDLSPPSEHSLEDTEYLLSGRKSKNVPRSQPSGLIFPLNDSATYYTLPSSDRQHLTQFVAETGYPSSNIIDTLVKLKRILAETPKADKLVPTEATAREIEPDSFIGIIIWTSVACFVIFFALIIASSYYSDDERLTSAGVVFAALGLFIHFLLMLLNGDCRKVKMLVSKPSMPIGPYNIRRAVDFFAVLNKEIAQLSIHWKMGDFGTYVALRRFTPNRNQIG